MSEWKERQDRHNAVPMTREIAIDLLRALQGTGDTEAQHAYGDDVLCALLKTLGFVDVVTEYDKIDKWFA